MIATSPITNSEDIIDSRDVIARIEALKDETAECQHGTETEGDCELWESHDELTALNSLADEAEESPDWPYGEALIRDSYFREYAEQLAEDIGAIDRNASWPLNYIDWEAAAEALQTDYIQCDFDGVTYWIRA